MLEEWSCRRCGTLNEPTVRTCVRCGMMQPVASRRYRVTAFGLRMTHRPEIEFSLFDRALEFADLMHETIRTATYISVVQLREAARVSKHASTG